MQRYEANRTRPGHVGPDPDLDAFDRIAEAVIDSGTYPLRQLSRLDTTGQQQVQRLLHRGLLHRTDSGEYQLSQAGLRRTEEQALRELLAGGQLGTPGRHEPRPGTPQGMPDPSLTRDYRDGDPLANLDVGETIRRIRQRRRGDTHTAPLHADDLVVMEAESSTRCHTALLLDRSGSMGLYGKFHFAKRLALGLRALLRRRFPEDRLTVIGFGTRARVLREHEVPLARPFSVGLLDNRIALRVRCDETGAELPEHFTNLQGALRLARRVLGQSVGDSRQILCLTDGEPTAHEEAGDLVLAYPPTVETAEVTLREVARCRQANIGLSFFALIDSPLIGQLHAFVDRMARVGRGVAAYCSAGHSARLVLDRFRTGRLARQLLG